jgi:hypothetical protein
MYSAAPKVAGLRIALMRGVGDEQQMWPIAVRSCRSKRNGANGHVFVQCV